jgi:hypothetical protein
MASNMFQVSTSMAQLPVGRTIGKKTTNYATYILPTSPQFELISVKQKIFFHSKTNSPFGNILDYVN